MDLPIDIFGTKMHASVDDIQNEYLNRYTKYLSYARLLTPSLMSAEDLVQHAFSNILEQVKKGNEIQLGTISAYLKTTIRNLSISEHKHNDVKTAKYLVDEEVPTQDYLVELSDRNQVIVKAIATLSPAQRTVVTMYYFDDLKVEEIAHELSLSESTIKTNIQRARKHIQAILESDEQFEKGA